MRVADMSKNRKQRPCIELPEDIYNWLLQIQYYMGRSPQDFIIYVLERFREVWNAGLDASKSAEQLKQLESMKQSKEKEFQLRIKRVRDYRFLVTKFREWCNSNNINIDNVSSEHIKEFIANLNEEKQKRGEKPLTRGTLELYRQILRDYLKLRKAGFNDDQIFNP
ncbi:MAG: hypothetical protein RXO76_06530 [Vulcanisaeta sp.]